MTAQQFCIRTLDEAEQLANRLARLFRSPEEVKLGLNELLTNAIEHGNLAIGYQEKGRLLGSGQWKNELSRRLAMPQYSQRSVTVMYRPAQAQTVLTIRDDGDGFDWQPYMVFDPERNSHSHGRGIALARLFCFSELNYKGCGNEVDCIVRTEPLSAQSTSAAGDEQGSTRFTAEW